MLTERAVQYTDALYWALEELSAFSGEVISRKFEADFDDVLGRLNRLISKAAKAKKRISVTSVKPGINMLLSEYPTGHPGHVAYEFTQNASSRQLITAWSLATIAQAFMAGNYAGAEELIEVMPYVPHRQDLLRAMENGEYEEADEYVTELLVREWAKLTKKGWMRDAIVASYVESR